MRKIYRKYFTIGFMIGGLMGLAYQVLQARAAFDPLLTFLPLVMR